MAESENHETRARLDLRFHQKIADIAGNRILDAFQQSLTMLPEPILIANLQGNGAAEDGEESRERIICAMKKHDADAVEAIMRQHLILSMRNDEQVQEYESITSKVEDMYGEGIEDAVYPPVWQGVHEREGDHPA